MALTEEEIAKHEQNQHEVILDQIEALKEANEKKNKAYIVAGIATLAALKASANNLNNKTKEVASDVSDTFEVQETRKAGWANLFLSGFVLIKDLIVAQYNFVKSSVLSNARAKNADSYTDYLVAGAEEGVLLAKHTMEDIVGFKLFGDNIIKQVFDGVEASIQFIWVDVFRGLVDKTHHIAANLTQYGKEIAYLFSFPSKEEDTFVRKLRALEQQKRDGNIDRARRIKKQKELHRLAMSLKGKKTSGVYKGAVSYYQKNVGDMVKSEQQVDNTKQEIQSTTARVNANQTLLDMRSTDLKTYNKVITFRKLTTEQLKKSIKEDAKELLELNKQLDKEETIASMLEDMADMDFTSMSAPVGGNYGDTSGEYGATTGGMKGLLGMISKGEGGKGAKGYNRLVYGRGSPKYAPLTNMTLGQVLQYQRGMIARGHASSAVGKYQFIRATLKRTIAHSGLSMGTKFTPAIQDKLAIELLKNDGKMNAYLNGKINADQFERNIAGIWASVAHGSSNRGKYDGDKHGNMATTKYGPMISAIKGIKNQTVTVNVPVRTKTVHKQAPKNKAQAVRMAKKG